MKSAEKDRNAANGAANQASIRTYSEKIKPAHLEKLAIVYVRQSSQRQVLENRESRERQYELVGYAEALGWPAERVVVIDEDQGQSGRSAEPRQGFQRLLQEVAMEHVGLVLGLETSRLARNSKDWHHLFELCGIFGALLGDQEGIYNANDPNDRLVLGLKGIISEMELQTMRNRLEQGRLNKAQRGELFHRVPRGYVILPTGEVDFDPDEQVQAVIHLVFDKFEEAGSVHGVFRWLIRHDIELPMRTHTGAAKGKLEWRRPSNSALSEMLRHPIYAGAYSYGRRASSPKRHQTTAGSHYPRQPMEKWRVLIKERLPAYISWERYLKNQERIQQNRNGANAPGVPRQGAALLSGILVCGSCGRRMQTAYRASGAPHYACKRQYGEKAERHCYGLSAKAIDDMAAQQTIHALQPAAVELSLQAEADIKQERQRLDKHWRQRQQRARYDAAQAEKRYHTVEPENRLVAATLEKRWEESLRQERELQEQYDRFLHSTPPRLSAAERERIEALSVDIPALWQAEETTNADRKQIIRCMVERVTVYVRCDSEFASATMQWAGGVETKHEFIRPVAAYAQMRDFPQLMERVIQWRQSGETAAQIAQKLNDEGFYPPRRTGSFSRSIIYGLLKRRNLMGDERAADQLLGDNEWWLTDLARELQMSHHKLRAWTNRGWLHGRRTPIQRRWVLWADADELSRLRTLLAQSRRGVNAHTNELKTPKERSRSVKGK